MKISMNKPIYLDYASSTPLDDRVYDSMCELMLSDAVGNPHSINHGFGMRSAQVVKEARKMLADQINADHSQLIFTSGATEANNIALLGLKKNLINRNKTHIITSKIEHKSVLNVLRYLENDGFQVTYLRPKSCGMVEVETLKDAIKQDTGLVTIQAINNELGVINPLLEISNFLTDKDIFFHVDGAQALGKILIDLESMNIDFMSFSSHKIYGPQGIGALYLKSNILTPVIFGGGQEKGLRPGTLSTSLCFGFGKACSYINLSDVDRLRDLREEFVETVRSVFPEMEIFGHSDEKWQFPGILSIRFPGIDNDLLTLTLSNFSFGKGSACGSGSLEGSHVIKAIVSEQAAKEVIRVSFGRFTTKEEIKMFSDRLIDAVDKIYLEMERVV
jgi:cysteine desulfurase